MKHRKKYAVEFKSRVALAAIQGKKTMVELCKEFEVHENMIQKWKSQAISNFSLVFGAKVQGNQNVEQEKLHAKIGELLVERDFLKKALKM